MELILKRITDNGKVTFGVLIENNIPFCVTLENPWIDNKTDVSCIPVGTYICKRVNSPKYGNTFEITNVPNRTHVLLHSGNWARDTKGCILLAEQFEVLNGEPAVAQSKKGYTEFMNKVKDKDEFTLKIYNFADTKLKWDIKK